MKAAQITQYTKNIRIKVNNVPIPKMGDHDVLIRVKAAAVNPVDILNLTGAVRLIQDYRMPLTPEVSAKWLYQLQRHWGCVSSYPETGVQMGCNWKKLPV